MPRLQKSLGSPHLVRNTAKRFLSNLPGIINEIGLNQQGAIVGYHSWLIILILINDLIDTCGLLFAFFQTILSFVGTDCLIMQEKCV